MSRHVALAARNNARWCDAVCRAHGMPGHIGPACWANRGTVPRFYPNIVTLEADPAGPRSAILSLIEAGAPAGFCVKDSYANIDLSDLGFELLFDASWIWRGAQRQPPEENGAIRWSRVQGEADLFEWEAAWAGGNPDAAPQPRVFPSALLDEPGVMFLQGRQDDRVVAAAIANRTGEVVGLSNVTALPQATGPHWPGCVTAVHAGFPGLPLVGYEAGEGLESARNVGFDAVGPLRVWQHRP